MRLLHLIWLAVLSAILAVLPAFTASADSQAKDRAEISLGNYDVVISDMGDGAEGWRESPTHVYVKVLDSPGTREMYFDSLPAAVFVLREMYGTPRILQLTVPEYSSSPQQGGAGGAWVDGLEAFYVWDSHRYCRGNLPLVLAFGDYHSAVSELLNREGELMRFENLVTALYRWADDNSSRIYWRGWDKARWDNEVWNQAWDTRWTGWRWEDERGWGCPGVMPGPGWLGFNGPGPGHRPGDDDDDDPVPPPGPPPGSSLHYHHEHNDGGAGPGSDNAHGQDNNGNGNQDNQGGDQGQDKVDVNRQPPRVRDDGNKQTPRVRDDANTPSSGAKGSGANGNGENGTGDSSANKPPARETGDANKQAPRVKDDAKQPSGGDKGTGGKSTGDKGAGDKGGSGKGSGRVK